MGSVEGECVGRWWGGGPGGRRHGRRLAARWALVRASGRRGGKALGLAERGGLTTSIPLPLPHLSSCP